jgi:LuxR family transcriptional regulator, maltose regulon positive regulatory protein
VENEMQKPTFFLRTKLLPPRPVSELLSRPRLTDRLKANINAPLTLVAADAGCGKTTLIADFIRHQERKFVWYQLDHTDADPFTFIGYITQGIRGIEKDFGETLLAYLNEANDEILQYPERAVDLLLNEIFDRIEQPLILVLDDYHHIGRETPVHKLVDRLLQYSSDLLHVIVTTRDIPPLAIMRHRTRSAALVITRDDLLFTDREVCELFKNTLNVELKDAEIQEYRERTEGWITALQLVRQVAEQEIHTHSEKPKLDLQEMLHQSEKDIFDYFAEEVFSREDQETQKILLNLSLLDSMPLDVCSRLFPDWRCAAVLPELVQKNVFLTSVGDGEAAEEYRLHPLFQDFLQRRLRSEIGREKVAGERNRIAEFYLAHNQWKKAIPYLLEAEEFERSAAIIADHGEEWLAGGAITTLSLYAEKIPAEALEKHPRALLHQAEVARHQGDLEKSSKLLNRAVILLDGQKDVTGEAEALYALASIARRKGKISEAFEFLDKAESLVSAGSETFMKCANTRGLCYAVLGDWSECERQFRLALELAEKLEHEKFTRIVAHNLAIPTGFRGEFAEALRWMKRIFREDGSSLPQEAFGYLNVGRMHLYRGELEDARKNLNRSLKLCQTYNMKPILGEIFEAFGHYYREKGDLDEAVKFFERSRKAYDDAGLNRYRFELEEEYATCFLLRGDLVKARGMLEKLLEERKKLKLELGIRRVELGLAALRFEQGENGKLSEELERSLRFFHEQNLNYEEAQNSLLLARVYNAQDQRKEMFEHLGRTLDLTARLDYEYWLKKEINKNPDFFNDEDVIEKLPLDLRENLPKAKAAVAAHPVTVSEPAEPLTDLTVKLLGPVEIYREKSVPFASEAWTTKRARDIFCYIASSRNRRVEKDVLIDAFWGAEDLRTIEKNFHPTISHIRKALNYKQPLKQNFLVFRDGAYQLNPEFSYTIDTEIFEDLIKEAERAKRGEDDETFRRKVEEAFEIYRGEFMSGIYDDWAEERRLYFAEQQARLLSALAKLSFREKKWSNALRYSKEILRTDPFREDAHRLVMKTLAAQGNPAAVQKQFETLEELLKAELGVEPAPETVRTFRELLN